MIASYLWQSVCAALAALCIALGAGCLIYRSEAHSAAGQLQVLQATIDQAHAQSVALAAAQAADTQKLHADLAAAQSSIRTVTREVIREIPTTATCPALAGVVRDDPPGPDLPADAPGPGGPVPAAPAPAGDAGPSARDLADTLGACELIRAEAVTWRDWYQAVVAK